MSADVHLSFVGDAANLVRAYAGTPELHVTMHRVPCEGETIDLVDQDELARSCVVRTVAWQVPLTPGVPATAYVVCGYPRPRA